MMLAERKKEGELEAAITQWTDTLVRTEVKMDRLLDLYLEGELDRRRYGASVRTLEAEARRAGEAQGASSDDHPVTERHGGTCRFVHCSASGRSGFLT